MRYLRHILLLTVLFFIGLPADAQSPQNLDEDIRALRAAACPGFCSGADDYIQYSPAVLMLGLKACGYEGRTGWARMITADVFSVAIMTGVTQSLKYAVDRPRPDGGSRSFPSGHTGTAFMAATMLHKEYGWRSPWWSIGGYSVAAFTGISRILNDRHWMSDVVAGAAIGTGSVHLGYWLSDLIFGEKHINQAFEAPTFSYDPSIKHYVASFYFGRRMVLGEGTNCFTDSSVLRGGSAGVSADIPVLPRIGVSVRLGANSLTYSSGLTGCFYDASAGGYYNWHFSRRFELQARASAGVAWMPGKGSCSRLTGPGQSTVPYGNHDIGAELGGGLSIGVMLDDNFKISLLADYNAIGSAHNRWLHSAILGWGTAWMW